MTTENKDHGDITRLQDMIEDILEDVPDIETMGLSSLAGFSEPLLDDSDTEEPPRHPDAEAPKSDADQNARQLMNEGLAGMSALQTDHTITEDGAL